MKDPDATPNPAAPGGEQSESVKVFRHFKCDCPGDQHWRFSGDNWQIAENLIDGKWEADTSMTLEDLDRPHYYEFTPKVAEPSPPAGGGDVPPLPIGFSLAPGFDPDGVPSHRWPFIAVLWGGKWKVGHVATATDTYALHWEYPNAEKWTVATPPPAATPGDPGLFKGSSTSRTDAVEHKLNSTPRGKDEVLFCTEDEYDEMVEHARELERESAGLREALTLLRELTGIIDAHEIDLMDCDRRGHLHCDCLERHMKKVREHLKSALAGGEEEKEA